MNLVKTTLMVIGAITVARFAYKKWFKKETLGTTEEKKWDGDQTETELPASGNGWGQM